MGGKRERGKRPRCKINLNGESMANARRKRKEQAPRKPRILVERRRRIRPTPILGKPKKACLRYPIKKD